MPLLKAFGFHTKLFVQLFIVRHVDITDVRKYLFVMSIESSTILFSEEKCSRHRVAINMIKVLLDLRAQKTSPFFSVFFIVIATRV